MRKHLYILSSVIISFFTLNPAYSQEYYYYHNNDKFYLFEDKKSIVLVFNEASTFKNRDATFENDTTIIEYTSSDGTEDIYFARLTFREEQNEILLKLTEYDIDSTDLEAFGYGFYTSDGQDFWATNEIAIKILPRYKDTPDSVLFNAIIENYNAIHFERDNYGVDFYKTSSPTVAINLAAELFESSMIEFGEPVFYARGNPLQIQDTYFPLQYYLLNPLSEDMHLDAIDAWLITKGSSNIKVAVIDDGVDLNPIHEDMIDNVTSGFTPDFLFFCD